MLLYELVGSNDRQLKLFDREVEECSCVMRKDMKINNNKPNKKASICGQLLCNGRGIKMLKLRKILKANVSGNVWLTKKNSFFLCEKK